MGVRGRWVENLLIIALAVVTVVLCYLALTREPDGDDTALDPQSPSNTSSPSTGSADPTEVPDVPDVPDVTDKRKTDFTDGDGLPDGARTYDGEGNTSPLSVERGALTHGAAGDETGFGIVEVELSDDVREVGGRLSFAGQDSGSVALVAGQESSVAAARAGDQLPVPGIRLVVIPGQWELVVSDGAILEQGAWEWDGRPATFSIVREGTQLWVVDPSGPAVHVADPRVAEPAGPWASWELTEAPGQVPASIEALWAG